ncbi:MAG: hypothetical protein QM528_04310 [Phycisphaerales bacterium]|nr:hypothetical protein [Phycisphaerales bacterium]
MSKSNSIFKRVVENYIVLSILSNKCPKCRQGNLYTHKNPYDLKHTLDMYERCSICNQPTELEVGFYYGTGYVSYAITVAFSVMTFVAWSIILGISWQNNSVFYWLICNGVLMIFLQPIFMRLSRTIWLTWFVRYRGKNKDNT